MAELTEPQKTFIVQSLAQFVSPADVARSFRDEFDIEIEVKQICKFDPTRHAYEAGEKWRPIFEATREKFLNDVSAVPISQQAYRLQILQQNLTAALKVKNMKLANETLKQAAEEMGGILTNERNVNIEKGGGFRDLTPDERRQAVAEMLRDALGADRVPKVIPQETIQ
jgi:hypothetical protein